MSQRHIRKILQSRSSLDDEASSSESDSAPTMKVTGSKKKKTVKEVKVKIAEETTPTQQQKNSVATSATIETPKPLKKKKEPAVVVVQHSDPVAESDDKNKATRALKKADARRRAKEKLDEEEQVLEAALSGLSVSGGEVLELPQTPVDVLRSEVLRLLSTPVANCLNTRTERIRSFGADSVEDVGDGPTRRSGVNGATIAQNGLLPTRPPGFALPKFRESPLATPNRYNWPSFSALGVALRTLNASTPGGVKSSSAQARRHQPQVYVVDWSDKEFAAAQGTFDALVSRMADINQMLDGSFQKYPFHLPTLVQLHRSFAVMGDAPNSQLMLDMAMYTVGVLLSNRLISASGDQNFVATRQFPYSAAGNRIVFETLKLGVQLALKRGCNRTAFNLHRLVLSLDITDPCSTLLSWDYLALRAREWDTILKAHSAAELLFREQMSAEMMRRESSSGIPHQTNDEGLTPSNSSSGATCAKVTPSQHEVNADVLARLYFALPGSHFCAALAKFLKESLDEQTAINKSSAPTTSSTRNVKVTDASVATPETDITSPTPSSLQYDSRSLMAIAMLRFPHAAWMLAEKLDLDINLTKDKGWKILSDLRTDMTTGSSSSSGGLSKAAAHVANLFVERCYELFKTKEANVLLMAGAAKLGDSTFMETIDMFQMTAERQEFACTPLLRRYRASTLEDVVGETVQRIPQELLNPAANMDEVQRDARAHEAQFLANEGFPQEELDALQRFEAVFGPLPVEVPLQQRFEMYDEMLQQYRQEIGNDTHPVMLFLQTLLPWGGNLRDMALQRAMQAQNVDDPVARRVAAQRRRDEAVWQDAADEAQRREDDESSSDEGW